jgi:hypothetical protein
MLEDIAYLVNEQGDKYNEIENNIIQTKINVKKAE